MATSVARKTATTANASRPRPPRKTAAPTRTAPAAKSAAQPPKAPPPARSAESPKHNGAADSQAKQGKKVALVRDSFTFPKLEYGVIGVLKTRANHLGRPTKKSEIVRAGIKALLGMGDAEFMACVSALPAAKPDRGSKA